MSDTPKHLVRPSDLDPAEAVRIRHPFNPNSDVTLQRLAERTGMGRGIVTLARVPPGKESFVLHAHLLHEEFIYVLEGQGTAGIGGAAGAGGPGRPRGFSPRRPAPPPPHNGGTGPRFPMGG